MGYYTWTFANRPKQKLQYSACGFVACPDGAFIKEDCYDGYAMFGGHDVYELVVDWNRDLLREIYSRLPTVKKHGLTWPVLECVAMAAMKNDEAAQDRVNALIEEGRLSSCYAKDWKRTIGIEIACETNAFIPFPIKITSSCKGNYNDLPASESTQ